MTRAPSLSRFAIYVNRAKEPAVDAVERVRSAVGQAGGELRIECETSQPQEELREMVRGMEVDAVICLGGDGTILRGARVFGAEGLPLLGVNLGRLGFLAEIGPREIALAVERLVEGRYTVVDRAGIRCRVRRGRRVLWEMDGLNEVLVMGRSSGRISRVRAHINGELLTTYKADGVIVATPTGSTGHALSAGGPVVSPNMKALLIQPVCPHTLAVRPMVISDQETITLRPAPGKSDLVVTVDGQVSTSLAPGDRLEVQALPEPYRVLRVTSAGYYTLLRRKLGWRGSAPGGKS